MSLSRVVDDRVDRDRRLAGLAVADDQLSLATADRDHAVDRHQAGLDRLGDRLALDDAGRFELGRAGLGGGDLTAVVEWAPERVDHAAQQLLADGDLQQVAGPLHRVPLDDLVPLAEQHDADVVGLEVQRQSGDTVRQLEHLQRHAVVEAVDAGDAVGHGKDRADLGEVGGIRLQPLDPLAQNRCNLVGLDFHAGARSSLRRLGDALSKFLQAVADARVEDHVSHLQDDAAEDLLVDATGQLDLLAGLAPDLLADLAHHRRVQLDGAGHGHVDPPVLPLPQLLELAPDAEDLRHPVLLDQQLQEVDELGIGAADGALQPVALLGRGEIGAEEEDPKLAIGVQGVGELDQLVADRVELALIPGDLEERLGVYASGVRHR
jgi:hypothetical protein